MSARRELDVDPIGPWAVLVGEAVEGDRPRITAYGPARRSAAEAMLEVLDLVAFDDPLEPFRTSLEVDGVPTVVVVAFGRDAVRGLMLADRRNGVDHEARWRHAHADLTSTTYPAEEEEEPC